MVVSIYMPATRFQPRKRSRAFAERKREFLLPVIINSRCILRQSSWYLASSVRLRIGLTHIVRISPNRFFCLQILQQSYFLYTFILMFPARFSSCFMRHSSPQGSLLIQKQFKTPYSARPRSFQAPKKLLANTVGVLSSSTSPTPTTRIKHFSGMILKPLRNVVTSTYFHILSFC